MNCVTSLGAVVGEFARIEQLLSRGLSLDGDPYAGVPGFRPFCNRRGAATEAYWSGR